MNVFPFIFAPLYNSICQRGCITGSSFKNMKNYDRDDYEREKNAEGPVAGHEGGGAGDGVAEAFHADVRSDDGETAERGGARLPGDGAGVPGRDHCGTVKVTGYGGSFCFKSDYHGCLDGMFVCVSWICDLRMEGGPGDGSGGGGN